MRLALSQVKQDLVTVEEYLNWNGEDNELSAKNQLICPNCGSPVFMKRGPVRKPHFSHFKADNEITKECPERVESLERDPQLMQRRVKAFKRFNISIFNQRAEEYLCVGILEWLKKQDIPLIYGDKGGIESALVTDDNQSFLLAKLFVGLHHAGHVEGKKIMKLVDDYRNGMVSIIEWFDGNKTDELSEAFDGLLSGEKIPMCGFEIDAFLQDDSKIFVSNLFLQLTSPNAMQIIRSFVVLSSVLQVSMMAAATGTNNHIVDGNKKYDAQKRLILLSGMIYRIPFMEKQARSIDSSESIATHLVNIDAMNAFCEAFNLKTKEEIDYLFQQKRTIEFDLQFKFSDTPSPGNSCIEKINDKSGIVDEFKNLSESAEKKRVSTYKNILKMRLPHVIIGLTNFSDILRDYYGDDFKSEAESKLNPYRNDRGCIYIASIGSAAKDPAIKARLAEMRRTEVVKIGKSKNPRQRELSLGGQLMPKGSVKIEMNFPAFEMSKTEKSIHRELKQYRLFPNRELFAFSIVEAIELVEPLVHKFEAELLKKNNRPRLTRIFGEPA